MSGDDNNITCPHCGVTVHITWDRAYEGRDSDWRFIDVDLGLCPSCGRLIIMLGLWVTAHDETIRANRVVGWPKHPRPPELSEDVPEPYRSDFLEAWSVLGESPKASAALTRRLLQHTLREEGGIKARDLNAEIDAVTEDGSLPSDLAEDLDELRHLGNFGTHPVKVQETGAIVDVERPSRALRCSRPYWTSISRGGSGASDAGRRSARSSRLRASPRSRRPAPPAVTAQGQPTSACRGMLPRSVAPNAGPEHDRGVRRCWRGLRPSTRPARGR